jgi:hypothetical protein
MNHHSPNIILDPSDLQECEGRLTGTGNKNHQEETADHADARSSCSSSIN